MGQHELGDLRIAVTCARMLRRVAPEALWLGAAHLDSPGEAVMLRSDDQYDRIGEHFARQGFGHLRPAAQFLRGLQRGAFR
jgi:hypothetical protein